MDISIIVPVFNEQDNVKSLHSEIVQALSSIKKSYEIIFVDDGSFDNTVRNLKKLSPVTIVTLRKNFGQTAAIDAGIKKSAGNIIIIMDGDGQNDPADIPLLLFKIEEGYSVVSGWRWNRKDSLVKRFVSRVANILRRIFINDGIHDSGCTLKGYKRECFLETDLYGEMHRFIPAILRWQGFRIGEVKVNHRPRVHGKTKYGWDRALKGFLDMISVWFWGKYSARPLHLFGGIGISLCASGSLFILYLFVMRLLNLISLRNSIWPLAGFFFILIGIQLLVSGLLADATLKSYYKIHKNTPYYIEETFTNK
jgi:glycosyltransferase involved in cell wall biosynthesis